MVFMVFQVFFGEPKSLFAGLPGWLAGRPGSIEKPGKPNKPIKTMENIADKLNTKNI